MSERLIADVPAGARLIPLTQGQFAIVDDEDFERLSAVKWCADWSRSTRTFYAMGHGPLIGGKRLKIRMHREVMNAKPWVHVDHINHDTLDNRRENLRVCTNSQNMANKRVYSNNTSGFKGVTWHRRSEKWKAQVMINGKRKHIGLFADLIDAARAYDSVAREHYGEFALTNQMLGLLKP